MNSGIRDSIKKLLYSFIVLISFYVIIQISVFLFSQYGLNENFRIVNNEKLFSKLNNNLTEIESLFLNYNLGYIPSNLKIKTLIVQNNEILKNLDRIIVKSGDAEVKIIFDKLRSNIVQLNIGIYEFFETSENSEKYILLKSINEHFFVSRLLLIKYKDSQNSRIESNIQRLKWTQNVNAAAIIILVILAGVSFISAFRVRSFVERKMKFLQDSISSFNSKDRNFKIVYDSKDEIKDVVETFNNMTATIAEQHSKLSESEKHFRYLFNNSPDALLLISENFQKIDFNRSALNLFNYKNIKLYNQYGYEDLYPEKQSDGSDSAFFIMEQFNICSHTDSHSFECDLKRHNGEVFSAKVLLGKFSIEGRTFYQATVRDATKEITEAEKMAQSQKMETIGTLAGGLAHDFNNVLSGITGPLSLIEFMINSGDIDFESFKDYIRTIGDSSERAKSIVDQLLSLSRKQKFRKESLNLIDVIKNVIKIGKTSFDKSVIIDFRIPEVVPHIFGDQTYLEQALLNILINSAHAMTIMRDKSADWGGTISINIELIENSGNIVHGVIRDYWMISIVDTGIGMSHETVSKIFNPFYTTKEKGAGTGLGLSMVYNTINQHEGSVNVYSELGKGSCFNIYLPVDEAVKLDNHQLKIKPKIPLRSGSVLIVDDEEIMRNLGRDILEKCGYSIVAVENGKKGIEQYRNIEDLKFVLLDIVMPELGGKETFFELKKIKDNIPIVITSGFREDERVKELLEAGASEFLKKPYTLKDLIQIVNRVDA